MLEKGKILDHTYKIQEMIGSGGGGEIYKAWHMRLETEVVIKRIKDQAKKYISHRAEADILKQLKHPYLPRVFDFLEIENEVYTVMEYIPGKTLESLLLEQGSFSQNDVLKWGKQLAEALNHLHTRKKKIIHSDIKPTNIMITLEGNVCLIDFNISLLFDEDELQAKGRSDGYAAPEQYPVRYKAKDIKHVVNSRMSTGVAINDNITQAKGKTEELTQLDEATQLIQTNLMDTVVERVNEIEVKQEASVKVSTISIKGTQIDERIDIYSLGATLYHLLTGKQPKIATEEQIPIEELAPQITEGLKHIITKCMAREKEKRYKNVEQLLKDFKNINKIESSYKKYIWKCYLAVGFVAACYVLSSLFIYKGYIKLQEEKNNKYIQIVSEGSLLREEGKYEEAISLFEEASELITSRMEAYFEKAYTLSSIDYEKGILYIEEYLNNHPLNLKDQSVIRYYADMYYLLADNYFNLEEYTLAKAYYEVALSYNTENSDYYRDYAIALARLKQVEEAKSVLQQVINYGIGNDSIYMIQAEISFAKDNYKQAVLKLKEIINISNNDSLSQRAYLLAAKAYKKQYALDGSGLIELIQLLESATKTYGAEKNKVLTELLGEAYTEAKDYRNAIRCFEELKEIGYSRYYILENIAILYEQVGDYQTARMQLEEMIELEPDNYRGYMRMAYLEVDMQGQKQNIYRDYTVFKQYYLEAQKVYTKSLKTNGEDMEMLMLEDIMNELISGGWFIS